MTFIILDDGVIRFHPYDVPIFCNPAKFSRAVFSGGETSRRFGGRCVSVVWMNNRKPEVRRRQPFLDRVSEHRFDIIVNKIDPLGGSIRLTPRFPNNARDARYQTVQSFSLVLYFNRETRPLLFCPFAFGDIPRDPNHCIFRHWSHAAIKPKLRAAELQAVLDSVRATFFQRPSNMAN